MAPTCITFASVISDDSIKPFSLLGHDGMFLPLIILADLLIIDPHTPSSEPVKYHKSEDGKWYTHDGVDVQETLQRKGNVYFVLFHGNLVLYSIGH